MTRQHFNSPRHALEWLNGRKLITDRRVVCGYDVVECRQPKEMLDMYAMNMLSGCGHKVRCKWGLFSYVINDGVHFFAEEHGGIITLTDIKRPRP